MNLSSYKAISDFIERNDLDVDPVGNCYFDGVVIYESPRESATVVTEVTFIRNGYNDGMIRLRENGRLMPETFHLDFSPDFQNYSFSTSNNHLIINWESGKMGGKYTVTISAT